jgi:hypothetical protein
MSSQLDVLEQLNEVKRIAADLVGDGLTYGSDSANECATAFTVFKDQTGEYAQVGGAEKLRIWRAASGLRKDGVPIVDLVTGEPN